MQIEESDKLQDQWYADARNVTLETLPEFIAKLVNEYQHDYGTVCHAIAASALAAAYAVERSKIGGITGFQSGAVMWQFVTKWMSTGDEPLKMVHYRDMLYPQYYHSFRGISRHTWEYLQKEAAENLKNSEGAIDIVKEHWQSIIDGVVPFGYYVD